MLDIILGNLCSILAMGADSFGSTRKKARDVLLFQALGQLIYGIGAFILKGYSAVVQNAVSIVRNLAAMGKKRYLALEWILIILGVVLGLCFNNRGYWGLFPVAANLEYSLAVFRFRDNERALKLAYCVCIVLFGIFNGVILNFVGLIANAVVLTVTLISIVKGGKSE